MSFFPPNQGSNVITTDYDSSAAEDSDLYSANKYKNADSALLAYSRTNKLEKLSHLLNAKLNGEVTLNLNYKGNQKQNSGWSALHLACYFGHLEVAQYLLSDEFLPEIDINIQNNSGDTPLHKAALTNRVQIVQLLLSKRANVFIRNCDNVFAKQLTNDKHILEMLIAAELVDRNRIKSDLFKSVDNGDLAKLQDYFDRYANQDGAKGSSDRNSSGVNPQASTSNASDNFESSNQNTEPFRLEDFRQLIDERGNTLLHLAAMRGFKAISIYLLERGFDPFKRNNIGQSCIDLASYQLRQLFANVKPSDHQLRQLSKQRVTRFEGPLLKKVRILGWRQIYVVLENGVILLFNNRKDSMNKSRKGYKYLESASCEPDNVNVGAFTISFSDKSRATFLVASEHLGSYALFKTTSDSERSSIQIELVRQKWVDSVRDHIRYSTDFIRKGLKLNENDERVDSHDTNDIVNVDQLLPLDTIKEFIQEARAHYSILERHAESLCSLIQQQKEQTPELSSTRDFLQDDWHCLLFHLRLLMESSDNTKTAMGQAIALMEHQEQIRQDRLQDQEERCRTLEDSLHALAIDHHELEKSLSNSQIYHSIAARSISMSMSTDLNEYYDAFEDFDDEKTMTPDSMASDEDLSRKIQEVMDDNETAIQTDDDDDLQSNCSALTVETISERVMNIDKKDSIGTDATRQQRAMGRTKLPSPMVPRDQVSIWSILKNCIGKELSKITMPVVFNEPLTMLQRACEGIEYTHLLKMADLCDDPIQRMEYICTYVIAGLSSNCHRIIKPFNPLLYETFEYIHVMEDGSQVKAIAQQVSHHPPITAVCIESDNFISNGSVNPKIKFWGRSIEVQPDGECRIYLKRQKETYVFKTVSCSVHNIIVGKLWFEHCGPLDIKCLETKMQANLTFKQAGWFSNDLHRFNGVISLGNKKFRFVYGKWSNYVKSADYSDYDKFMKNNQQKMFRIPDEPDDSLTRSENLGPPGHASSSMNNNNIPSGDGSTNLDSREKRLTKNDSSTSFDIKNSRTLWKLEMQYLEEYYNFTYFTLGLNELTPELAKVLPRTDSRFRPDVRKLEEGDLDAAASEKQRLEEKQREARSRDKRFKDPSPDLLWFELGKDKIWTYKGGYWENRCNPDSFPDLF